MRLKGRRVLVTGAASGIGLATSRLFAAEGAAVAMLDRDAEKLGLEAKDLGVAVAVDVRDEAEVRQAVASAIDKLGGLDGVVNCAGVSQYRPFAEVTGADWTEMIAVNLNGPFYVCSAALSALKAAGRGTIVNIASGAALRPIPNRTGYCSAKAGLVMFSKALAMDLAGDNIRVNAICPGIVDTPMFGRNPEGRQMDVILDRYLIKRMGQPEEIAYAALYLTSDESSYTTGTAIAVDGGRTFH
jgi:NAD(P)-dependent dehydrogenase (short-subunit alcohol dehydrogenase family)